MSLCVWTGRHGIVNVATFSTRTPSADSSSAVPPEELSGVKWGIIKLSQVRVAQWQAYSLLPRHEETKPLRKDTQRDVGESQKIGERVANACWAGRVMRRADDRCTTGVTERLPRYGSRRIYRGRKSTRWWKHERRTAF